MSSLGLGEICRGKRSPHWWGSNAICGRMVEASESFPSHRRRRAPRPLGAQALLDREQALSRSKKKYKLQRALTL
eukprot:5376760-Pyramimonas_sp.AAC.2